MLDLAETILRLEGYLRTDPNNAAIAGDLVDALFSQSLYPEAEAVIASLPDSVRLSAALQFRASRCSLVQGRYDDAINSLLRVLECGADHVAVRHDLAFCQLCLRRTTEAKATLANAVKQFGDSVELALVRARVALMEDDFIGVYHALDAALAKDAGNSTALGLRALALFDQGRSEESLEAAKTALAEDPDQHEALLAAGSVALNSQELAAADEHFQRALSRHPNSGRALSGAGQVSMLQGDLTVAKVFLERAVAAMPQHIGTWHALAWTSLLVGDLGGAETAYRAAYDLDRNFADSHGGLGLVHALKGEKAAADGEIRRALRLDPNCTTALYAKSVLLTDSGSTVEASQLVGSILAGAVLPGGMSVPEFVRALRARLSQPPE